MSFHTAEQILQASDKSFAQQPSIEVDLSGVKRTDSAGLALLLEWISRAGRADASICFTGIPEKVLAIAETAEIDALLSRSYSSSSKK
jgi:phospholipid transport system transporter-binding protein